MNDFLEALKPESVFMQIPPDLPLFIRTKGVAIGGYRPRWFNFLKGTEANFYVSTKPDYLSDIMINNKDRLKPIMNRNIEPAIREFEIG